MTNNFINDKISKGPGSDAITPTILIDGPRKTSKIEKALDFLNDMISKGLSLM
jgi:pentatricopeptide repeat protein